MAAKMSSIGEKLRNNFNYVRRCQYSLCAAAMVGVMNVTPTLCAPTMKGIFNAMMDILFEIAFYCGAVIVILGIFNWIMAQKDENADGQSRAIKFCVVGIALVCLKTLVAPILNMF